MFTCGTFWKHWKNVPPGSSSAKDGAAGQGLVCLIVMYKFVFSIHVDDLEICFYYGLHPQTIFVHFKIYVNGQVVCELLFSLHIKCLKFTRRPPYMQCVPVNLSGMSHGGNRARWIGGYLPGSPQAASPIAGGSPQWPRLCQPWRAERPPAPFHPAEPLAGHVW